MYTPGVMQAQQEGTQNVTFIYFFTIWGLANTKKLRLG